MVARSLALATTGLIRTAFVLTRSIHTFVLPQLDLLATYLPMPLVYGRHQTFRPPVLDAQCSGRGYCDLAKTPLGPWNRT